METKIQILFRLWAILFLIGVIIGGKYFWDKGKPGQAKIPMIDKDTDGIKYAGHYHYVPGTADIAPEGDTIIWIENHSEIK